MYAIFPDITLVASKLLNHYVILDKFRRFAIIEVRKAGLMKILFMLFAIVTELCAETFVFADSYRTLKKSTAFQTQDVWAQQDLTKSVGAFGWAQYSTTYRQIYGGLYVRPTKWLQVGVASGVEQAKSKARLGTFTSVSKGKYFALAIYENGGSGYWYLALTDVAAWKRVSIGSHSQTFVGHGPRADVKLGKIGNWVPSIRPGVTWERESGIRPNVLVGLRFTYFKGD